MHSIHMLSNLPESYAHAAGAPFELSKRKWMTLLLLLRLGVLAAETGFTGVLQ